MFLPPGWLVLEKTITNMTFALRVPVLLACPGSDGKASAAYPESVRAILPASRKEALVQALGLVAP